MPMPRLLAPVLMTVALTAHATPVTYAIDPTHTFPSFEADHMGGVSVWRGKFNKTSGQVVWDRTTGQGTVDITVDMNSVDYGLDIMNDKARSPELFDTAKYPTAVYKGRIEADAKGQPTKVTGALTLHGVTKEITLTGTFNGVSKDPWGNTRAGFTAEGKVNRKDFGMVWNKTLDTGGFVVGEEVNIRLDIECIKAKKP